MKFSAVLFANLLAASAVVAVPRNSRRSGLAERVARREAARSGAPLKLTEESAAERVAQSVEGVDATQVTLESTNWGGGILTVCNSSNPVLAKENTIIPRNLLLKLFLAYTRLSLHIEKT